MKKCLFVCIGLFLSNSISAQNRIDKNHFDKNTWFRTGLFYNHSDQWTFLYNLDLRYSTFTSSTFATKGMFRDLYRIHNEVGVEKVISTDLKFGQRFKIVSRPVRNDFFSTTYLVHRAFNNGWFFNKGLILEYISRPKSQTPGIVNHDNLRISFDLVLRRRINYKRFFAYPYLGFRPYLIYNLEDSNDNTFKGRTFDMSRLVLGIQFKLLNNLGLNLFYLRQVNYFLNTVSVDPVKVNNIQPFTGIRLNLYINGKDMTPKFDGLLKLH